VKSPKRAAPSHCANCGAVIPARAKACPECGADERTGWAEQSIYDGLDLPEESFSDESIDAEATAARERGRQVTQWFWRGVGLLVLAALIGTVLALR